MPKRISAQPPFDGNPFEIGPPPTTGTAGTAPKESQAYECRGSFHLIAALRFDGPLFVDHIIPLKRGGADEPWNMQWQTTAEGKAKDATE